MLSFALKIREMRLAIIGATGLVGREMLKVLEERNIIPDLLIPVGSDSSEGKKITFNSKEHEVLGISKALYLKPEIVLFSAGSGPSKEWAPKFAAEGSFVIDNSSAWRYDEDKRLIVPEVNGHLLGENDKIIANPNCSTIQLVMVLQKIHELYGLRRVIMSTYQSVSGSGKKAVKQMEDERAGKTADMAYPHPIDMNAIPHIDVFQENGYSREEMKIVWESRKIMSLPELRITATAVRIPTVGGHSESVNIECEKIPDLELIRKTLSESEGIEILDNPGQNEYPMPLIAHGKDEVFVGRIRKDESLETALNLWIVSDNLRKGAATNAVQIAELVQKKFLGK